MTSPARAAQAHLLTVWSAFPIGTRVVVRNWIDQAETSCHPWIDERSGVALIKVVGPVGLGAIDVELSALSLAGPTPVNRPPLVRLADVVEPMPAPARPAFFDRPAVIVGLFVAFFLVLGVSIAARFVAEHSSPGTPPWLCEEWGVGCEQ